MFKAVINGRTTIETEKENTGSIANNTTYKPLSKMDYDKESVQIIDECQKCIKIGTLTPKTAAYIIVGKIRQIYYSTCVKHGDHFDIQTFAYMDQILFDNLNSLIESIIKYGATGISKNLMKQTVKNVVESVEYEANIDKMNEVIDIVYLYFT